MKQILILLISILSVNSMAQNNQPITDWAGTNRFAIENKNLKPPAKNENRVVFMGNSITESWKIIDSSFFANNSYTNRGISSQTTVHMLARFQQDVIALQPKVVVILAGINDIAQNNGPIAIKDIFYNIVSMAQLAKANKIKVILCSVLPAFDFPWRRGLEPAEKINDQTIFSRIILVTGFPVKYD